jgi:tetratricopeptide (TPR) repeat protein
MSTYRSLAIATCTALLWSASYFGSGALQAFEGRKRPEKSYSEHQTKAGTTAPQTPIASGDRQGLPQQDKNSLKRYAEQLFRKQAEVESEQQRREVLLDILDTYREVLLLDEHDDEALLALADISFGQKLFGKAADYFERYLKEKPEDEGARARYASALSFIGKIDAAIKELQHILEKDPKNFQGLAFLAIAYAQKGEKATAQLIGNQALEVAPHEEAKNKLKNFLDKLNRPQTKPTPPEKQGEAISQEFENNIKNNPVAGPKFVRGVIGGDNLVLIFKDFPMQAMPLFALEKFLTTLRNLPGAPGARTVIFIDAETGQPMASHPFMQQD